MSNNFGYIRTCKRCNEKKKQMFFTLDKKMCLECREKLNIKKEIREKLNIQKKEKLIKRKELQEKNAFSKKELSIYKLEYNNNVIYIGSTTLKHLSFRKAIGYPKIPLEIWRNSKIILIEKTYDKRREYYWISYYKSIGTILYNIVNGKKYN